AGGMWVTLAPGETVVPRRRCWHRRRPAVLRTARRKAMVREAPTHPLAFRVSCRRPVPGVLQRDDSLGSFPRPATSLLRVPLFSRRTCATLVSGRHRHPGALPALCLLL